MDKKIPTLNDFKHHDEITTRWHDNDIYGHVNNVVYYSFFDTAVNKFLIQAGLDIHEGDVIGFAVNSQCDYFRPIAYPDTVVVGLGISKLGNSSVRYELAIFSQKTKECCAAGSFTHVFVNRDSQKPTPIPDNLRNALQPLMVS